MKTTTVAYAACALFLLPLSLSSQAADSAVNCDTAQQDLDHLQHEKKSTDERKVNGVMSIMPIGLAINATADMTESDADKQKEMDIDEYNKQLDARIEQIKSTCGVQ